MADYYRILGVSPQATDMEIKSAYRKLAKRYHPDVVKNDQELTKKMYEIQAAYQVIGDKGKRQDYDISLKKSGFADSGKEQVSKSKNEAMKNSSPDISQFERFFGFQAGRGMETYQDSKQHGKKPEGPIKPEEMFAAFFGKGKR